MKQTRAQHAKNELAHSLKRLKERHDPTLLKEDIKEICKIIRSPNMGNKLLLKSQGKHTMWLLMYNGRLVRAIYNEETMMTTTFLDVYYTHQTVWAKAQRELAHAKIIYNRKDKVEPSSDPLSSFSDVARIKRWKK